MIKLIAVVAMTIDHIGLYLFPGVLWLRLIGRIAMPLFVHEVARGTERTKDIWKYLERLMLLAVVSQIPWLMLGNRNINIVLNLVVLVYLEYFVVEYGFQFIQLNQCSVFSQNDYRPQVVFMILVFLLVYVMPITDYGYYTIPVYLLFKHVKLDDIQLQYKKWLFYAYYPAHLAMLALLKAVI